MLTRRSASISVSVPEIPRPQPIRCLCEIFYDDEFMMMCQKCARWCHGACFDFKTRADIPDGWRCWICAPTQPGIDKGKAIRLQQGRFAEREEQARNRHFTDLAQIPSFTVSVQHVRDCYAKLDDMKVHGGECRQLVHRCLDLLLAIRDNYHYDHTKKATPLPAEIANTISRVYQHILEWTELSTVKAFIRRSEILGTIQSSTKDITRFSAANRPGIAPKASLSQKIKFAEALLPLARHSSQSDDQDSPSISAYQSSMTYASPVMEEPESQILTSLPSSLSASHSTISRNELHKNLFYLLRDETSFSSPSAEQHFREGLHAAEASIVNLDPVVAVARSSRYRECLVQLLPSKSKLTSEELHQAIQKDDGYISDRLYQIATMSEPDRREVLKLKDGDAESFMDLIQTTLDGFPRNDLNFRRCAHRLLVKLSEASGILPASLSIHDVELLEKEAIFGGGFADIYRATFKGQEVALKRMRVFQRGQERHKIHRAFCREALLWQRLRHPHVLPFLGVDCETFSPFLCIVSPWMRHGTVMRYLAKNGNANVNGLIMQIAKGLQYLHSQSVVHGDLRGGNILINDQWQACLADFGLTIVSEATVVTHTSNSHGSTRWMAPELHDPESFGFDHFLRTAASDVYAFACVCLEVFTGLPPFAGIANDTTVMLQVIKGGRPSRPSSPKRPIPDFMWMLIRKSWGQEPAQRLTIHEVIDLMQRENVTS